MVRNYARILCEGLLLEKKLLSTLRQIDVTVGTRLTAVGTTVNTVV